MSKKKQTKSRTQKNIIDTFQSPKDFTASIPNESVKNEPKSMKKMMANTSDNIDKTEFQRIMSRFNQEDFDRVNRMVDKEKERARRRIEAVLEGDDHER